MINNYIRTLVILILIAAVGYASLILWQSDQHNKISEQTIHYHNASIGNLDEIHKEILILRNKILLEENRQIGQEKNVSDSNILKEIKQGIYIIDLNYKQLVSIQERYQSPEFSGLLAQLEDKMKAFLVAEEYIRSISTKPKDEIIALHDSILLTLIQFERLHKHANKKLFEFADLC